METVAVRETYWGSGSLPSVSTAIPIVDSRSGKVVDTSYQHGTLVTGDEPVMTVDVEGKSHGVHKYLREGDIWEFSIQVQLPDEISQYYPGYLRVYGNINLDNVASFGTVSLNAATCLLADTIKNVWSTPTLSNHNMNLFYCLTGAILPKGSAYFKLDLEVHPWSTKPSTWQLLINHSDTIQVATVTPTIPRSLTLWPSETNTDIGSYDTLSDSSELELTGSTEACND